MNTYWPAYKNYKIVTETPVTPTPAPSYTLGDVNQDGKINSNDALAILQYSTGAKTLNSKQLKALNIKKDRKKNTNKKIR